MSIRRIYETTFIVNAAIEDADVEAVISKVSGYIENNGGQINEINRWGRRRLAYPINKKYNGYYVHFVFEAKPALVPILERFLVLEDTVLRHLTLILPKKLKDYRVKVALETGRTYDSAFIDADKAEKEKNEKAEAESTTTQSAKVVKAAKTEEPAKTEPIEPKEAVMDTTEENKEA
jgi:small subunit ribosomal protein S6